MEKRNTLRLWPKVQPTQERNREGLAGSALCTAGRRWPEEGTVLTQPASAAAEQWLRGRLAGPRQRCGSYARAGHWQLLAQTSLTKGNYKLLCQLLELKVTGQPKVTCVELKDEAIYTLGHLAVRGPLTPGRPPRAPMSPPVRSRQPHTDDTGLHPALVPAHRRETLLAPRNWAQEQHMLLTHRHEAGPPSGVSCAQS